MKIITFWCFALCIIAGCATNKKGKQILASNRLQETVDAVKKQFAPDSRTALYNVQVKGNIITGETNLPEAKAALLERLQATGIQFTDSLQLLPHADAKNLHAVVTVSVANLRTQPKHAAELATQALLSTPLKVWKKEKGWYFVQTPDHYLAWVDGGGIAIINDNNYNRWQQAAKIIFTNPFGFAYAKPVAQSAIVSDLVYGALLSIQNKENGYYKVAFPDGRTGFVQATEATLYSDWISSRQPTTDNFIKTSKQLMGLPYLWGGTSFKGVDCSGFTKTVFYMNGLVLPRDASQQIALGTPVETSSGWQNLQPGDLLFFGVPAQDGRPERVVHVGMWIGGNQEFIHSSGSVQVSSFNPKATNYDAYEHKRFLRAKRISPTDALYDVRTNKGF